MAYHAAILCLQIFSFECYIQVLKVFSMIYLWNILIFYSFPQNSVHNVAFGAITSVAATLPIHPFHVQLSPLVF